MAILSHSYLIIIFLFLPHPLFTWDPGVQRGCGWDEYICNISSQPNFKHSCGFLKNWYININVQVSWSGVECSGPNKVVSSPALRAWASGLAPVVYMCNHNNIWKTSRDEGNKVYSSSHLVCKSKEGKSMMIIVHSSSVSKFVHTV